MVVKSNPTGDLIFSLFRQKLPVVDCHMFSLMWRRPWDPFSGKLQGKWENCSFFLACAWLFWPNWLQFCVCLCHALLFTQVVLVWVSVAGGFVICAALGLSAFAVLCSSCGSFLFLLPVLPEGAVIYGQRLTSFAEASNSCANRSIKWRTGRKRWEINKINILQTTHTAILVETQKQRNFCNGWDQYGIEYPVSVGVS